jgi:RNA polymerase sigma-70 factor (ECF subfamily)
MLRVRDRSTAEDLVHDTLLAALKSWQSFQGKSSFSTWLVGILRNKTVDHFRKSERTGGEESPHSPELDSLFIPDGEWRDHWDQNNGPKEWSVDASDIYERSEFMTILENCMNRLPERLAAVFSMREMDGMKTEEICKVLEISPTNLWVMLHRGRMQLRRCLELTWLERKDRKNH